MIQKRSIYFSEPELEHLHTLKLLLKEQLTHHFTIKELCSITGMNRFKLNAGFKELTGTSIYQYVLLCKVECACAMLLQTDWPVKVVAIECGFRNGKHFMTFFKKRMGVSPGAYRTMRLKLE